MKSVQSVVEFEWDDGNVDKSYQKHGIAPNEAEEVFLDSNLGIVPDPGHSGSEGRFVAIGKTTENKVLFIVFTMRNQRLRVISARIANRRERRKYEQKD
ncbi:MAG: BrnT family toxin [bacterium]|nr:BrnT family toxin [bacterium]